MLRSIICCAVLCFSCCTISCCTTLCCTISWCCMCTSICCAVLGSTTQCAKTKQGTTLPSNRYHMRSCSAWPGCSCSTDCVAAYLQKEFAGCCSQACLEAPRLLRPPKQAGYYGNWTTYRYQSLRCLSNIVLVMAVYPVCYSLTVALLSCLSYYKLHLFPIHMHPSRPSRHVIAQRQAAVQPLKALSCI